MAWDGRKLNIENHECVRCMHCINLMPKALRPGKEPIADVPEAELAADLVGRVREVIFVGCERRYIVDVEGGHAVTVRVQEGTRDAWSPLPQDEVRVSWKLSDCVLVADPTPAALEQPETSAGVAG